MAFKTNSAASDGEGEGAGPIVAEINPESLAAQYIYNSGLDLVVSTKLPDMLHGLSLLKNGSFKFSANKQFIQSLSRSLKARDLEKLLSQLMGF